MKSIIPSMLPPQVVVLAGPNGAGKSTASTELIQPEMIFINADEIAKTLNGASVNGASVEQVNLRAGRIMLERLNDLADSKIDFALETTLANRSLAGRIQAWKQMGYQFTLLFLMLPSADVAVQRVKARVASGGHDVPEETIRRRYTLGLKNFFFLYLPIADVWGLYENSQLGGYKIIAEKPIGEEQQILDEGNWQAARAIAGETYNDTAKP